MKLDKLNLQLTADGSYTLSRGTGETFHSRFGAVTEAKHVFLRNSSVEHRLRHQHRTRVLEIGFGSGLNFLLTARCAKECNCELSYVACDVRLPPLSMVDELLSHNVADCKAETAELIRAIEVNEPDSTFAINSTTDFRLLLQDADTVQFPSAYFHAVYLDAFSNNEDPVFWQTPFLLKMFDALQEGGRLATYSVNRSFKNSLHEAGFAWQKLPGPTGKREVLVATKSF